jgi:hypothetical protein
MLIKIRFRFPEVAFGILLAVAIFAMGATLWSSHYPSSDKQHTEANQHSATKSNDKTREPQSLWIPTDSVGLYTLVLCVFTGVLALVSIFQGVMLLRSDKTSRIAADAAKLNAQAVIAAEGAYIFVEICRQTVVDIIKYMQDMPSVSPRPILIQYRFMNHGKTPAVIKEISYGAIVAENLPKQREYSQILHLPNSSSRCRKTN